MKRLLVNFCLSVCLFSSVGGVSFWVSRSYFFSIFFTVLFIMLNWFYRFQTNHYLFVATERSNSLHSWSQRYRESRNFYPGKAVFLRRKWKITFTSDGDVGSLFRFLITFRNSLSILMLNVKFIILTYCLYREENVNR